MTEVNWYWPKNIDEIGVLLKKDGYFVYGGGTHIFKTGLEKVEGFISLVNLRLEKLNYKNNFYEFGGAATFSQVSDYLNKIDPDNILYKALNTSASTPLRNQITLGGSIVSAPIWSDLLGPLYLLNAEIELLGKCNGFFSIEDFYRKKLMEKSLVKNIKFKKNKLKSYYYRFVRTQFDYSAFNISMAGDVKNNKFVELKIYIVGTKDKISRLSVLENKLKKESFSSISKDMIFKNIDFEFADKKHGSSSYLKEIACVEIKRGLERLIG